MRPECGQPTYRDIAAWVEKKFGFRPQDCWVAHCKELAGLKRYDAGPHRPRERECPQDKRRAIFCAFAYFDINAHQHDLP